jgi:tetratricopeptide (TPR) repeat protein
LDAYDLYLRALTQWRVSREGNSEALRLLRRAIEIDPQYAAPYGLAAHCYDLQRVNGWVSPSDPALAEGVRLAKLAASLGQDDPDTLAWASLTLAQLGGDVQGAVALSDRAIALNPNSALAWRTSGALQACLGNFDLAIARVGRSARLSPLDADAWMNSTYLANSNFGAGRYEEASLWADRVLQESPNYPSGLRVKAATCGLLGRLEEGREWVRRLLAIDPHMTVSSIRLSYELFLQKPHLEAYLDGLRKAGLPE